MENMSENKQKNKQDKQLEKVIRVFNRISLGILLLITVVALYIMVRGIGTEGKDFGPGSYYYTDIPAWQEIFYKYDK